MAHAERLKTYSSGSDGIDLNLSEAEATTLMTVLAAVGGDCICSPMRHTEAIYEALQSLGIQTLMGESVTHEKITKVYSGGITFHDDLEKFEPGYFRKKESEPVRNTNKIEWRDQDPGDTHERVNVEPA